MKLAHINVRPFVLTVQELPKQTAFIMQHFKERGIEAEEFPCFSAVESGLVTVNHYEVDAPGQGWRIGPKGTALCVSFYAFWIAVSFMPEEYFFFLEFDAEFPPDWRERTEQALRDVPPDFDLLFIGSCCCEGKTKTHVKGNVWECKEPNCNHAMIVAKKAVPTLLRTQRKIWAPADISMVVSAFPHLRVFVVLPSIAGQFNNVLKP
jgi:hypothetical protein